MSFFESEVERLDKLLYSNKAQLDTVKGVKNYIDHNFEQEVNLAVLAQSKFVSKYHLLRLFKQYYGQTPKQYLTDKRMEKAKEYLKKGMTVTETCFAVGFKSLGSFSALFKRRNGISPIEFQKEQLSRSN
ncbi:MAG: AraC family transcriptional regulator [Bacteroidota bacterium]